ncbi:hypothetical protein DYB31_011124 [Aphanomyces astaci]|uniref:Ion transport domain-containing protein n=3 Tax=Aphanomyces astaci TaxID=112090 RepID=A0A397FAS1_APHAT|nr:hypothetical protein DYB31_011124 [Aphanomyces astaci]
MTSVEMTSLTRNVDRKVYTPLDETKPAAADRALVDMIVSLKDLVDRNLLANKDVDSTTDTLTLLLSINGVLRDAREAIESLVDKQSTDKWVISFDAETYAKKLMYAEKQFDELLEDAVKADVAELLVQLIRHSLHDEASLVLLYELTAGGSVAVQNALYYAIIDAQPAVLAYLLTHLENDSANIVAILQQLCVYHHSQWQALMRVPAGPDRPSFLNFILANIAAVSAKSDVAHVISWLDFLCETCQGPSVENQLHIASSDQAIAVVRDIVLDVIAFDSASDAQTIRVQRSAAEVLLTLMEGRVDGDVHVRLAALFPVAAVVDKLQLHYRAIQHKLYSPSRRSLMQHTLSLTKSLLHSSSKDELQRHLREFRAAINLLRIVTHVLHDKTTDADATEAAAFETFRTAWHDALANGKVHTAVRFFQDQLVSIEVARNGATFTSYFLRPATAQYFNETLQTKLIDEMDIGSEGALDVLTSEVAKSVHVLDVEEELAVIQGLNKTPFYSIMNKWHVWLRKNMLRLCFYINFVMLLCVRVDNSTMVDIHQANMRSGLWVVGALGFVLLGFCAVLWLYHVLTTFCFNYCKQHVSPLKLSFTTSAEYWTNTLHAFAPFAVYLEFFVAIFVVIFYMDMVTTTTKILAAGSFLWLFGAFLQGVRHASGLFRFTVNTDKAAASNVVLNFVSFWYNVVYDTLLSGSVITFGAYTLCAICGLGLSIPAVTQYFDAGPWGLMFFGFPLVDILATNEQLRFIVRDDYDDENLLGRVATAMHSNMGKLGVTAVFGAIMIYIFSLVGFFLLQAELESEDHTVSHCSTLLQCYTTYIRYGLLSGGGIGDYISSTLNHELEFDNPERYFERLVYDMAFFVVVITLFLNMIQGIIIDAFTSVREQTETKAALKRERCLVCNRSRSAIELEGVESGLLNNFARHTQDEHNFFHYFFYIQHVTAKDPKDLNGIESYVVDKLKTQDMTWIPRV